MKKKGLLLVNLGSPSAPTTAAVKHYLSVFLGDRNVVTMPPALWQPLLKGIILPMRSWRSATFYRDIWMKEGSPLVVYTARLTKQVQDLLPDWDVRMAMTYEQPSIKETLIAMQEAGEQITVLALSPTSRRAPPSQSLTRSGPWTRRSRSSTALPTNRNTSSSSPTRSRRPGKRRSTTAC